jgi:hypothetical protein
MSNGDEIIAAQCSVEVPHRRNARQARNSLAVRAGIVAEMGSFS